MMFNAAQDRVGGIKAREAIVDDPLPW